MDWFMYDRDLCHERVNPLQTDVNLKTSPISWELYRVQNGNIGLKKLWFPIYINYSTEMKFLIGKLLFQNNNKNIRVIKRFRDLY